MRQIKVTLFPVSAAPAGSDFLGARSGISATGWRGGVHLKESKDQFGVDPCIESCCLLVINGDSVVGAMANERRNLVREIRKALCELPADELFLIAKNTEQIDEREESQVELGDEEGCFDFGLGPKHGELRRDFKQLVAAGDVTDDTLLRQLVKVTSEEEERQRRIQSLPRTKVTHAQSAQIEGGPEIKAAAAMTEQTDKEIRKLITQVEALTNVVTSLQQAKEKEQQCQCMTKAPEKRRRPGCPNCIKQGKEQTCSHCFFCGEEGHRAVGCLNRQKMSAPSDRPKSTPQTAVPNSESSCRTYTVNAGLWKHMGRTAKKPQTRQPEDSGEKTVQFVGKKCLLEGEIGGYQVSMLLDTETQVSIIDQDWRKKYLPTHDVRPLSEIVGPSAGLEVFAINGEAIPFSGWVEATGLAIGKGILTTLHSLMSSTGNTQDDLCEVSVGFIRADKVNADTARVRVGPRDVIIRPGQVANVKFILICAFGASPFPGRPPLAHSYLLRNSPLLRCRSLRAPADSVTFRSCIFPVLRYRSGSRRRTA
ncbi:Retrovirus-related Pol poly from transposon [Labeo rohita]|uniref:Retrovirus-related Pol poly from transposon n=1 Tax=Labeo rohita TaxID=84645 RepID=A0A498LZU5_LABRO|nr:Retrovirus-related Pol poly from transposon [Labeo rohita]